MEKYILLYKGPATAPGASHEKWPAWFGNVGENLIDRGSPMSNGFALGSDLSKSDSVTPLNGYSIIQARDLNDVENMVKDHPYLAQGHSGYSVEIFELE